MGTSAKTENPEYSLLEAATASVLAKEKRPGLSVWREEAEQAVGELLPLRSLPPTNAALVLRRRSKARF